MRANDAGTSGSAVAAAVTGLEPLRITANALAGPPARVSLVSGGGQTGTVGRPLATALVFEAREEFARLKTPDDVLALPPQRLQTLRIGVFGRSPGADWMLRHELLEHAVFYTPQSGDPAESPAHVIEQDLSAGKIDMAIVWGPIAGFLASRHAQQPVWTALPFKPDPTIRLDFEISMGVRFGEKEWKDTLDQWISAHEREVQSILASYRVPLLDAQGELISPRELGANQ